MKLFEYNNAGPTIEDYEILFNAAKGLQSVLEFGPGSSTWAFIEAEVSRIVSCEYNEKWMDVAKEKFGDKVELLTFDRAQYPLQIPEIENERFDLALVDSPVGCHGSPKFRIRGYESYSRWNSIMYAVERSDLVFLHDAHREGEQNTLNELTKMGFDVYLHQTPKGLAEIRKC
jgi:hypothetical protein